MTLRNLLKLFLSLSLVISLTLGVIPTALAVTKLPDLAKIKDRLVNYHDSGDYNRDIAQVVRKAFYYLRFRITQNDRLSHPKKLAIVLDIDETALSNYHIMQTLNFGGRIKEIVAEIDKGNDPPIQDTRTLFKFAKKHNISIFFVTGRHQDERAVTVRNLHNAGYRGWTHLYMKPNNYKLTSVVPYKSGIRKEITKMGYDIVLNMGDQNSDLAGGYSDKSFKLPNPYYYIR